MNRLEVIMWCAAVVCGLCTLFTGIWIIVHKE